MDTDSRPAGPDPRSRRRSRLRLALAALGLVLAATIALLALTTGPTPTIVWLPQTGPTQSAPLGKLAQIKAKIKNLTAPIWRPLRRNRRQIQISSNLMRLSPDSQLADRLGAPIATNSNGLRAWVFEPEQLRTFIPPIDAVSGVSPACIAFDGSQVIQGIGTATVVNSTNDSITVQMNFTPKIVSGSVQLTVGVTWISGSTTPSNANLVACRALLPNGGALVIDCPQVKSVGRKDYWFIFSPLVLGPGAKATNAFRPARAYTTSPPHSIQQL